MAGGFRLPGRFPVDQPGVTRTASRRGSGRSPLRCGLDRRRSICPSLPIFSSSWFSGSATGTQPRERGRKERHRHGNVDQHFFYFGFPETTGSDHQSPETFIRGSRWLVSAALPSCRCLRRHRHRLTIRNGNVGEAERDVAALLDAETRARLAPFFDPAKVANFFFWSVRTLRAGVFERKLAFGDVRQDRQQNMCQRACRGSADRRCLEVWMRGIEMMTMI